MFPLVVTGIWVVQIGFGLWQLLGWRRSSDRPPSVVYKHLATALCGLALWIAFVVTDEALLAWMAFAVLFLNNELGDRVLRFGWGTRNPARVTRTWRDRLAANWEIIRFARSPGVTVHAWLAGVVFFSVLGTAIAATL
jgi:hypothetical protein